MVSLVRKPKLHSLNSNALCSALDFTRMCTVTSTSTQTHTHSDLGPFCQYVFFRFVKFLLCSWSPAEVVKLPRASFEPEMPFFHTFASILSNRQWWKFRSIGRTNHATTHDSMIQLIWKKCKLEIFCPNKIILNCLCSISNSDCSLITIRPVFICVNWSQIKSKTKKNRMSAIWHFVHVLPTLRGPI